MPAEDDTDVLPFVDAHDAIALWAASNALADGASALGAGSPALARDATAVGYKCDGDRHICSGG